MPDPVDYRAPTTEPPHPKRSVGMWLILVLVWVIGVAVWGLYLAFLAFLLVRFL